MQAVISVIGFQNVRKILGLKSFLIKLAINILKTLWGVLKAALIGLGQALVFPLVWSYKTCIRPPITACCGTGGPVGRCADKFYSCRDSVHRYFHPYDDLDVV